MIDDCYLYNNQINARALIGQSAVGYCAGNVPVKSKLQHPPPGKPPGHLNFWKIFVQIPPSRGRKAVQMPHHRSIPIPGDQMPPPPGNFSVAFIMLRKLCM